MSHLILSDDFVFYTLEGEGEYIGQPSVFMRLAMCNLTCKGFASPDSPHGCDSYVSWSKKNKMSFEEIFKLYDKETFIDKLEKGAILKITGGEPLIQGKALLEWIAAFDKEYGFIPRIDFETNATLQPDEQWITYGATFTTSPKLLSNGDPRNKTYVPKVLKWHAENESGFKFVVQKEEDLQSIKDEYIKPFNIDLERIWLMPCAGSREEHIEKAPQVAEWAKEMCVNFSPRLHLLVWNKALKV